MAIPISSNTINNPYSSEMTGFYTDPILYYVIDSRNRRGYVGQSRRGLVRLAEHIIGAYSNPNYKSGAANIIRDNMCKNTFFRYFTIDSLYGVPNTLQYFLGMKQNPNQLGHWELRINGSSFVGPYSPHQLLDVAEVIHIIYNHRHGFDLSSENIKGGGQGAGGRFKLYYVFSDYELTRIGFLLKTFGVNIDTSRLSSKLNNYHITQQDLAVNTLKVTDPVSDVVIRELLEKDVLSQIVQNQDFIDELKKACYGNTATFLAFLRQGKNHKQALQQVSSHLNNWLQNRMQQIIKTIIYQIGNYSIDVSFSSLSDFDYESLISSITNALSSAAKSKVLAAKNIDDALNIVFKTAQGAFRKVKLHIAHKFYANIDVTCKPTEAPWLAQMDIDWDYRRVLGIDVQKDIGFSNWIKEMSFCGFYQNVANSYEGPNMIGFTDTLKNKVYEQFKSAKVNFHGSYDSYYAANITLLTQLWGNPLYFDWDYQEIETAFSRYNDGLYIHAWPASLKPVRTKVKIRGSRSNLIKAIMPTSSDGTEYAEAEQEAAREYLFLESTAKYISRLQGTLQSADDLYYY